MSRGIRGAVEQLAEGLGWLALLLLLVAVMFVFGATFLGVGIDYRLHHVDWPAVRPGIELTVIPFTALTAAHLRIGADRIIALRASRCGPYLPLLMAGSAVGLITYLVWSWATPLNSFGPDEFGVVRWLATVLAAAFTIIWLPLFPRVTATSAGMIAGPALIAIVGYTFFAECMPVHLRHYGEGGSGAVAILFALASVTVWLPVAIWLSHGAWFGGSGGQGRRPVAHALWSGAIMAGPDDMGNVSLYGLLKPMRRHCGLGGDPSR